MYKLTKEIEREFWERCGLERVEPQEPCGRFLHQCPFDKTRHTLFHNDPKAYLDYFKEQPWVCGKTPPIDLNNLFKWAVPKLIEVMGKARGAFILQNWIHEVAMHKADPVQALKEIISKSLGGKE